MRTATLILSSVYLLLNSIPLLAAEAEPVPVVEEPVPIVEDAVENAPVEAGPVSNQPAVMASSKDAPGRVARLSLTQGEVSLAPAGTDEWADAVLNRPLTSGDRVWVDSNGRAEFQAGAATVHLDQNTGFSFEQLDDDAMRMNLTEGSATVRVRRKLDGETIVVETPNASVALLHTGEYHIEVNDAGDATVVKARSGEAAVTGEKDSYIVRANEVGTFKGTKDLHANMSSLGSRTAFESWANDRDAREERSASSRYVSRDVIGYEDLDEDGDWISEPEYGYVWTPRRVYAGWAPYRDGRWAWVSPWGWTWVDNARWGFAPFHYGRWAYLSNRSRWCWVPGPRHLRPVYAPALVGWVGSPGVSVSVGFGSGVGWFPLGPREVYVPGYWHSRRYINNVNITNTVIVNNRYINDAYRGRRNGLAYRYRDFPTAVTVVPRNSFVGGRAINDSVREAVSRNELRRWRADSRPPAIAPDHGSVFAGGRTTSARDRNDRFDRAERLASYRNREASSGGRVSFDTERRAIENNGNRPVSRSRLFANDAQNQNRDSFFHGLRPRTSNGTTNSVGGNAGGQSSGDVPQWRDGGYRNRDRSSQQRDTTRSDSSRTRGDQSRRNPPGNSASNPVFNPPAFSDRSDRSDNRVERGSRRDSGSSNSNGRTPRTESLPRPSFDSVPRSSREDRSQRFERQREARQTEQRVQAAPAQESRPAPAPRSEPRASRGDRGGDQGGGGKQQFNSRSSNRQSQKQ